MEHMRQLWSESAVEPPHWRTDVEPWQRHTPFARWLIEKCRPRVVVELGTHKGDSYFNFCQAIRRNGIRARAYAVDT